jgi:phospholipid/cholesterol/gamma-HCH transport system substrate-binding protein
MDTSQTPTSLKIKVGVFTLLGLLLIGAATVFMNNRPFWWRPCQLVHINIEDATGLKSKSPVKSLGLQIGYLHSIELSETHVRLGICITAPVEVLPSTRAYIRGEGFLGDKFVELKPVKFTGAKAPDTDASFFDLLVPSVHASEALMSSAMAADPQAQSQKSAREIPVGQASQDVQKLVEQVDGLVSEMKGLTNNLREAINPQDLRRTMLQLNKTLENASKTLSPGGGLNTTAQRTLEKLEDSVDQLRDVMSRINKGEGSIGMLINDPVYAQELRETIRTLNSVINRLSKVRIVLNLGAEQIEGLPAGGSRGFLLLNIWPNPYRYYRLGVSSDPRGSLNVVDTTTVSGGVSTTVQTTTTNLGGFVMSLQMGRVFFRRLDLSIGLLHGDGAFSTELNLGPTDREEMFRIQGDIYARGRGVPTNGRAFAILQPFINSPGLGAIYVKGGLESFRKINNTVNYSIGAGLMFDDEDLRILFAFR